MITPRRPTILLMSGEKYSNRFDWRGNVDITMDMNESDDGLNITDSVTKDLKTKEHDDCESYHILL